MMSEYSDITQLLNDVGKGDPSAYDKLFPLIYDELRNIAQGELGRAWSQTMRRTELVHEAYLKLINQQEVNFNSRTHFFAIAARAMRQILVDYARRKNAKKRGGKQKPIPLDEEHIKLEQHADYVIAIDELLEELGKLDERMAEIVELRFFVGMSIEETASLLNISTSTVDRDWTKAKGWLYKRMKE